MHGVAELIELAKGEDAVIPMVFYTRTGLLADVSVAAGLLEVTLVVKALAEDASAVLLSKTYTGADIAFPSGGDGTDGQMEVTFGEADTDGLAEDSAEWVFDVWLENGVGKQQVVREGRFRLLPRVGDP